jgi:hypothetical protein
VIFVTKIQAESQPFGVGPLLEAGHSPDLPYMPGIRYVASEEYAAWEDLLYLVNHPRNMITREYNTPSIIPCKLVYTAIY